MWFLSPHPLPGLYRPLLPGPPPPPGAAIAIPPTAMLAATNPGTTMRAMRGCIAGPPYRIRGNLCARNLGCNRISVHFISRPEAAALGCASMSPPAWIVLPTYNERSNLEPLLEAIHA